MTMLPMFEKLTESRLFGEEGSPLCGHLTLRTGDPESNLCIVLGDNASGKSLLRQLVQGVCRKEMDAECIHLSMAGRAQNGIMRALVYGDEQAQSTGDNSAGTVIGAIRTSRGRDKDHWLFFDEPDIGLSDDSAAGAALEIASFLDSAPETAKHLGGCFIVTHRRCMVSYLLHTKLRPHMLWVGSPGTAPEAIETWVGRPLVPVPPEVVREKGKAMWSAMNKWFKAVGIDR